MFRSFYNVLNIADRDDFEKMTKLGVEPCAGACIKDEAGVDMAIERGATLITCNNPGEILALLRAKGYHK
jgi:glycerophosphoryl diester phosphodiesterase